MYNINLRSRSANSFNLKLKESCHYQVKKFTDNQIHVKLNLDYIIDKENATYISGSITSNDDLIELLCLVEALRANGINDLYFNCYYLLGGRSDKRFNCEDSFDLKIIANLINSCFFKEVIIFDPHSDVTPALINNCKVLNNTFFIDNIIKENTPDFDWTTKTIITPDAGAFKKSANLQELYNCKLITASKVRVDGIPQTIVHGDVTGLDCVIIDDICDGGRTFTSIAVQLKQLGANSVTLFVTHGIFSNGVDYVLQDVDVIYTTNSFKNFEITEQQKNRFFVFNISTL